jgi:hypothetical protein
VLHLCGINRHRYSDQYGEQMSKYLISTILAVAAVYAMSFVDRSLEPVDYASIAFAALALCTGWIAIARGQVERDSFALRVAEEFSEHGELMEKANLQRAELLNQKLIEVETKLLDRLSSNFEDTQVLINHTSQHLGSELSGVGNSVSEKHQEVQTRIGSVGQQLEMMGSSIVETSSLLEQKMNISMNDLGSSLCGVVTEQGRKANEGLSLFSESMKEEFSCVNNELSVHKKINEGQSLKALDKVQQAAEELRKTLTQDGALKSEQIRNDILNSSKALGEKLIDVQSVLVDSKSELRQHNIQTSEQIFLAINSVQEAAAANDVLAQKAISDLGEQGKENHVDLKEVISELFRQQNEKSELAFEDAQKTATELCVHIDQLGENTSTEIVSIGQQSQERLAQLNDDLNTSFSEVAQRDAQVVENFQLVSDRLAHDGELQTVKIQSDISCLGELLNESLLEAKSALLDNHAELWKKIVQASEQDVENHKDANEVVSDLFRKHNEESVLVFEGIQQTAKDLYSHIDQLGEKTCLEIKTIGQQSIEKIELGNSTLASQNDSIAQESKSILEGASQKIKTVDALVQLTSEAIKDQVQSLGGLVASNHVKIEEGLTRQVGDQAQHQRLVVERVDNAIDCLSGKLEQHDKQAQIALELFGKKIEDDLDSSGATLNRKYDRLVEQLEEVADAQRTQISFNGSALTPEDLHLLAVPLLPLSSGDTYGADAWEFDDGNIARVYSPGKLLSVYDKSSDTRTLYSHDDQEQTVTSDIEVGGKLRYRTVSSHLGAPVKGWEFDGRGKMKVEYSYDDNGQLMDKKIVNA